MSNDRPCYCDNCNWHGPESKLWKTLAELVDLDRRLDAGSIVPVGECPECSCLAYFDVPTGWDFSVREGWFVANEASDRPVILRDDAAGKFLTDSEAVAHVRRLAAAGSAYHRHALKLTKNRP